VTPSPRLANWRLGVWPALLTALALYLPTLAFSWAADDHWYVVAKPWSAIPGMFNIFDHTRFFYRPLSAVSYLLNYELFGPNPGGWHAVNLLWYLACVYLAYLFYRRLTSTGLASIAALLFAIQPVHPGAVSWIAALADLQATSFVLLAGWAWLSYRQQPSRAAYLLTFAAVTLALLSKEAAVALVPALLLGDLLLYGKELGRHKWRSLAEYVGIGLPLVIYLSLRFFNLANGGVVLYNFWWQDRPGDFWISNLLYLLNSFGIQLYELTAGQVLLCGLVIIASLLLVWRLGRVAVFMLLWVPLTLAPVVPYLTAISFPPGRTVLLPSVGASLLLALLLGYLYQRAQAGIRLSRWLGAVSGMLVVTGWLVGAALHNYDWYQAGEINKRIISDFHRLQPVVAADAIIYFRDVPYEHGIATVVGNRGLRYMLRQPNGALPRVIDMVGYTDPAKYCLAGDTSYFAAAPDGGLTRLASCQAWLDWRRVSQ